MDALNVSIFPSYLPLSISSSSSSSSTTIATDSDYLHIYAITRSRFVINFFRLFLVRFCFENLEYFVECQTTQDALPDKIR